MIGIGLENSAIEALGFVELSGALQSRGFTESVPGAGWNRCRCHRKRIPRGARIGNASALAYDERASNNTARRNGALRSTKRREQ